MPSPLIIPPFPSAPDLQEQLGDGDDAVALANANSLLRDPLATAGLGSKGGDSEFRARGVVDSEQGNTGGKGQ